MRICVTGAGGKVGRAAVHDLRAHGHDVTGVDVIGVREFTGPAVVEADLTDAMQAHEVLAGMDAVVHTANIPAPELQPPTTTFHRNVAMNFNVLHAAVAHGLQRVVWTSSETTLGLPFDEPPMYLPVDEEHYPRSTTTYALSKVVTESMADELSRWSQIPMVALRLSNVHEPGDYAEQLPAVWGDLHARDFNLWGYIDVRDAAQACRLALEAPVVGTERCIIAAADTVMDRPTAELVAERWPGVEVRRELGEFETLLSIDHARELLGYEPVHSWRDELGR